MAGLSWGNRVGLLARYSNRPQLLPPLADVLRRIQQPRPSDEHQPRQVAARPHRRPVKRRLSDDDVRRLAQRYRDGATAKELAAAFGIGVTSVKRLRQEHDAQHTPKLTAAQMQTVFACYRAGTGPRELARRYGVTDRTIKYLLQKHGVQGQRDEGVTEGSA